MKYSRILTAVLSLCALASVARCQNAALMPIPKMQFFDANGYPLAGGLVYTCVAGSSCPGTPLATYTDSTAGTPKENPVVLDAGGFASIWLGSSAYKIVLQNSANVTQWSQDNVSNNGLALSGSLSGSNGATLIKYTASGTGAVSRTVASKLGDVVSVKDFGATGNGSTDDTAAINAAIAAAPVGGIIHFPAGTYNITGLTINKAVSLVGEGAGGLTGGSPTWDVLAAATKIVNTSTSADAVKFVPTGSAWLSDIVVRDLAILGNRDVSSATAGDGLKFDAATFNAVRHVLVENVLVYHAKTCGIEFANNSYGISVIHGMSYRNGGSGICVTDSGSANAVVSSLFLTDTYSDLNTTDALSVSSAYAGDISIVGGFYADSGVNGVHVTSAAINAKVSMIGSHFESNANANVLLEGGYGHIIQSSTLPGDHVSHYGIYISNPGSNFWQVSAEVRNNEINTNITNDVYIASTAKNVILAAQSNMIGNYSISDAGYQTQYPSGAYHSWLKNAYQMNSIQPCIAMNDATNAQTTPNKQICSRLGVLAFINNGGSNVANILDTGDLQFHVGSGSVVLSGSPTSTRTVTFPDYSGSPIYGYGGNAGSGGTTGSITSQSVGSGSCVDTGALNIAGYVVGMAIVATPNADPGAWFVQKIIHTDASHFKVQECNVSSSSQTVNAVSFYVRIIQ